ELEPTGVLDIGGDEGSPALLAAYETVFLQELDRLADSDARHAKLLLQILDGRDFLAGCPMAALDASPQLSRDLYIERHRAQPQRLGKLAHDQSFLPALYISSNTTPLMRLASNSRDASSSPVCLSGARFATNAWNSASASRYSRSASAT